MARWGNTSELSLEQNESTVPLISPLRNTRSVESLPTLEALASFQSLGQPLFPPFEPLYIPFQGDFSVSCVVQLLGQGNVPYSSALKLVELGVETIVSGLKFLNKLG